MSDSATQATKTVVERTQVLAQKIESGVRKEALEDVRRAREVVKKADKGLSQLFDRIEHWAEAQPKTVTEEVAKAAAAAGEVVKKVKAKVQSATSQPS